MSVEIYDCPNCGATLSFDADRALVTCDYCHSTFTPQQIESFHKDHEQNEAGDTQAQTETSQTTSSNDFGEQTHGYHCDNCGAEVITEESTSSAFCYYCHSPVIFTDRISGQFAPDKIIPFKISKDAARQAFLKWAGKHRLVPKGFASNEHLEKISGIYVPFWMAKAHAQVEVAGTGESSTSYTTGRKRVTTVKTFQFERSGEIDVDDVKTLASDKVDKPLIYAVESSTKGKLVDFSTAYLSGFFSQQYTIARAAVEAETHQRINEYVDRLIRRKIGPYSNIHLTKNQRDISISAWYYILLPVWILTYQFRDKTYVYALNGETGEFFGELPLDKLRLLRQLAIGLVAIIALLLLGGRFIW